MHMLPTHLKSQHTKRIHVTSRRSSGVGQSEASRFNQFWGGTVEEPIDLCPWHGGWNGGRSEASDTGTSINVHEDISLDRREHVILRVENGHTILRFPWTTLRLWIRSTARAIPNTWCRGAEITIGS
jgi:hypothetical protein